MPHEHANPSAPAPQNTAQPNAAEVNEKIKQIIEDCGAEVVDTVEKFDDATMRLLKVYGWESMLLMIDMCHLLDLLPEPDFSFIGTQIGKHYNPMPQFFAKYDAQGLARLAQINPRDTRKLYCWARDHSEQSAQRFITYCTYHGAEHAADFLYSACLAEMEMARARRRDWCFREFIPIVIAAKFAEREDLADALERIYTHVASCGGDSITRAENLLHISFAKEILFGPQHYPHLLEQKPELICGQYYRWLASPAGSQAARYIYNLMEQEYEI